MIRSFIALEVTDETILNHIKKIQEELGRAQARLKLVEPQNLHFTLHFLGNVESARIPDVKEILQELEFPAFDIELSGLRCFRPARLRVVWVGVTKGADECIRLQQLIGQHLRERRFPVEGRKYSPHLTVARVRRGANRSQLSPVLDILEQYANHEFGVTRIKEVKLKKSTLTPRGPIYEDLEVRELS
ncbi:MAG: RNA 2',3'-cyclic phosphodiesterase [Promethearchaeota archaeon]